jgi:hypothetical protein
MDTVHNFSLGFFNIYFNDIGPLQQSCYYMHDSFNIKIFYILRT